MEVIKVENVTKAFGDFKAVDDISFDVQGGTIMGVLGPNGAGKTTTIRMITNILIPDSGSIKLFGEKIVSGHQNHIGYLPEERGLYKKLKVLEQLEYFGQLKGLSSSDASNKAMKWLKKMDAEDWGKKKVQDLSKGMQQKVQFISTIMHDPDLIILDEPFSGFDPVNTELLKSIILDLKKEGKTILLSTHIMEQAEQMCDEICLINKGKMMVEGNLREIKKGYGRDTVIMEYEGSDSFLEELSGVDIINKSNNRVEFRFQNGSDSHTEVLKGLLDKAVSSVDLYRFELVEPSLHEIFIDVVTKSGEAIDEG